MQGNCLFSARAQVVVARLLQMTRLEKSNRILSGPSHRPSSDQTPRSPLINLPVAPLLSPKLRPASPSSRRMRAAARRRFHYFAAPLICPLRLSRRRWMANTPKQPESFYFTSTDCRTENKWAVGEREGRRGVKG